ncbi:MAG: alkaline phytoceramidase [Planctomycetes bacterium]|nr:alkaline phytoceramidase [Planctomycetota bacterium]
MNPKYKKRAALVGGLFLAALVAMFFVPAIPQDPAYHDFADRRSFLGIPNFGDVVSNLPFLAVGLAGLFWLARRDLVGVAGHFLEKEERRAAVVALFGVLMTGVGSAYYHWAPDNTTLFWDRLPMTLVFMSLFASQIMERISVRAGAQLLVPLLVFGASSILSWRYGEGMGKGDLRLYALVQFYPMIAIPLMLALFPPKYTRTDMILVVFGWYFLAKVLEAADRPVLRLTLGVVSGHTLKHLAAAAGTGWLLWWFMKRRPTRRQESGVRSEE